MMTKEKKVWFGIGELSIQSSFWRMCIATIHSSPSSIDFTGGSTKLDRLKTCNEAVLKLLQYLYTDKISYQNLVPSYLSWLPLTSPEVNPATANAP